ncbi:MAG: thioredoxin family protein [Acidobacteria bacterium]|nr:thioredoxin family protein [Acidobacteriota bacterium]
MSHLVELFYSQHCPGCPEARALVQRFVAERPDIVLMEHNVDDDAQLAKSYHLIATPALVIDRWKVMYGVPRADALAARIDASGHVPT